MSSEGYYIEYIQQGASIKVSALDPKTGTEVSIVGASNASQADLNRIVVRKLEYVIAKNKEARR